MLNDKIKGEAGVVISNFLPLSNQTVLENEMTKKILSSNPTSIKICTVEGCERLQNCKSFCKKHYTRFRRNGFAGQRPIKICSVETCSKKMYCNGLCQTHNLRWRKYKSFTVPNRVMGEGETFAEKFWSRVAVTANPEKCWNWFGTIERSGYGRAMFEGRNAATHRIAFALHNGYMPVNFVLHSCDNRKCVNPNHLREGTHQENMDDMVKRNRSPKGERHPLCILNEEKVREIRCLLAEGQTQESIAKMFGVNRGSIAGIARNIIWKHVI